MTTKDSDECMERNSASTTNEADVRTNGVDAREVAIRVTDLHKSFRLPTERSWGLKQAILNRLKGVKGYKEQKVLNGLSFEVKKGEFFGIVGRNGSGKSTLLKTLAGIYTPEKGKVEINGSLVPFIELGVGFNPELTGRENIYLNGALLGFSNEEMDKMYHKIVHFAELEDLVRIDFLVAGERIDALAIMCHRSEADSIAREVTKKLKEVIPRQNFEVALQAAIGARILARETLGAYRKDVTLKIHTGDRDRKAKLLQKQKRGKARMKRFGKIDIPSEAFTVMLKRD